LTKSSFIFFSYVIIIIADHSYLLFTDGELTPLDKSLYIVILQPVLTHGKLYIVPIPRPKPDPASIYISRLNSLYNTYITRGGI